MGRNCGVFLQNNQFPEEKSSDYLFWLLGAVRINP